MALTQHFDYLHVFAGMLVGVLVGLTGVGGGSLMTPLLVLLFGVSPQTAVGTDLLFAAMTKIAGSVVHGKRETVDWSIVRRMACGSVPAAILTLVFLSWFGKIGNSTEHLIMASLAVLLGITAIAVICRKWLLRLARDIDPVQPRSRVLAGTVLLGAAIGVAVSISSVGAGAIGMTVLLVLYPKLPVARIVGSDIAHAVPLALIAGFGHWIIGDVDFALLGVLLIGSIPGVVIGSYLSSHAPDRILQPLLACVLAVSSWQLFLKANSGEKHHAASAPAQSLPARSLTAQSAIIVGEASAKQP